MPVGEMVSVMTDKKKQPSQSESWRYGKGSSASRGYGSRWRKARAAYLLRHPLCRYCERQGRVTPATVVDHIKPHNGDQALFWDSANWQPLCKACHDSVKQSEERRGESLPVFDVDGYPI